MKLPRLHVVTDADVIARDDFAARLEAVAALGPRIAVQLRDRNADGRTFWNLVERWAVVVQRHGAMLVVSARADMAALVHADAVQLGTGDLSAQDARRVAPAAMIGRSVHSLDEARDAVADGADFLVAGTIYATPSHPGHPGSGLEALIPLVGAGRPVIAIGGITPARAPAVHAAGAWGIAVIRAVWDAPDPVAAAEALLAPWEAAA